VRLILDAVTPLVDEPTNVAPGGVVWCDRQRLHVATGGAVLSLDRIQPAGKRAMEIAEFLRGHPIQPGEKFGPAAD
jgi:methionyl-tRNA formyltransferase